jgi:hypothetical protein
MKSVRANKARECDKLAPFGGRLLSKFLQRKALSHVISSKA